MQINFPDSTYDALYSVGKYTLLRVLHNCVIILNDERQGGGAKLREIRDKNRLVSQTFVKKSRVGSRV